MNVKSLRGVIDRAGLPQPDRIYSDKLKRGRRFKLVWGAHCADGSRIHYVHPATEHILPATSEELEPLVEYYTTELQTALPDKIVRGHVAHGFMYGWDIAVTIHEGESKPLKSSGIREFRRKYGWTQG